jgi:hypothetical protein
MIVAPADPHIDFIFAAFIGVSCLVAITLYLCEKWKLWCFFVTFLPFNR